MSSEHAASTGNHPRHHRGILLGLALGVGLGLTVNSVQSSIARSPLRAPITVGRGSEQVEFAPGEDSQLIIRSEGQAPVTEHLASLRQRSPELAKAYETAVVQRSIPGQAISWVMMIAEIVGKVFLRLMFMVVVPLVFSALSLAVIEIGDVRRLGRMGLKTLIYTATFSSIAVLIGIGLVNAIQPGLALPKATRDDLLAKYRDRAGKAEESVKRSKPITDTLVDIIPENPLQEMVGAIDGSSKGNGMLAVMFFALICGVAATTQPEATSTFAQWLEGLHAIAMAVIGFAMKLAPFGAGCLVFKITAELGLDILQPLLWFVATALLGLGLQLFVTYPIALVMFARMSPMTFFRGIREAMMVAFGTSSSSATLPTAMRVAVDGLKLPDSVSNFVLTIGATGNQNGTALFEGVVVLFLAQVMGVELSASQQVVVVMMAVLAGVGTAGVPGGSLPLIVAVLQSVGVPGGSIAIIVGVDRLIDMCRTVVNVSGDLAIAACVARGEPIVVEPPPPPDVP